jgi:hypothetical protein
MNEQRDEATGQFTSAEPLVGLAGIEHEAGYVPYKEEPAGEEAEASELTVEEAADRLTASRTPEADIKTYSPLRDLPENVTLTIEQAAKIRTEMGEADADQADLENNEQIRKEVDELRGAEPEETAKESESTSPEADVEKFLAIPHVKQAVDKLTGEAETARHQHVQGLAAATQIAEASFFSQFPEFAKVTPEQRSVMFAQIAQNDPARAQAIHSHVTNLANLFDSYSAENKQVAEQQRAKFQNYAKAEDARFETLTKGESKETMRAVEKEIPVMLKSLGVDPEEFLRTGSESRFLRSAAAQAIMVKAAKYDMLMKAPKPTAAAKALPPVQRPGISSAVRNDSVTSRLSTLEKQFKNASGDKAIRIAAQMHGLKQRARG